MPQTGLISKRDDMIERPFSLNIVLALVVTETEHVVPGK